ncbi:MAG: hypothetical protein U0N82_09350 [Oscillospiraceae bacterium]
MAKMMKATIRNGRATASGKVYNANHNTRAATRAMENHIDHERTQENINFQFTNDGRILRCGSFDAKDFELERYEHLYGEGQRAKNDRYIQDGHPERCKTIQDIYSSKRTAPMETIVQLGNRDTDIAPQERMKKLAAATFQLIDNLRQRWGDNFHILDVSIHLDESVVHAHIRSTFSAQDKFGYQVPNQAKAFEAMDIQRPDPTAKEGKYNCPLMTFSEVIRSEFYDLCERQGVVIDREVKSPSQKHLSVLEYKCQQMSAEVATLSAEKQQLEAMTAEQAQAIETARAEIEEVRAERDTLRDQNSVSRTIQEALKLPERPIEAEYLPVRKSLSGKVIEAEAVKISRTDYEWLRERATLTTAIKNAWEKLQEYGRQLWAEVDRNARVQAAEQRAELAERQTRADAITMRELTRRAERAETQAQEQEQFMRQQGIWQRFVQLLEAQRQQTHHRTR